MTSTLTRTFKRVFCLVCMLGWYSSASVSNGADSARCFAIDTETHFLTMLDVAKTNASTPEESANPAQTLQLNLCPDSNSLQIVWPMNTTKTEFSICYSVRRLFNWYHVGTYCYLIRLNIRAKQVVVTCWFEDVGRHVQMKPAIESWTKGIQPIEYSGHLNTAILTDMNKSCNPDKNVCQIHAIDLHDLAPCQEEVHFRLDDVVKIRHVTFTSENEPHCTGVILPFTVMGDGKGKVSLNCGFNGPGNMNVSFDIHGILCNQMISRPPCSEGPLMQVDAKQYLPSTSSAIVSPKVQLALFVSTILCVGAVVIAVFCFVKTWRHQKINRATVVAGEEESQLTPSENIPSERVQLGAIVSNS